MNYAVAPKAPIRRTSICTQTDVSWVGAQLVTRKQHPAASVTSRPLPSISRSVDTTTHVANIKTVAPIKSSPPKKNPQSNKPFYPKQQDSPVHDSDAYFTVKTNKGEIKESSPTRNVEISPIQFKTFILEQRTTEEISSGFRFFYPTSNSHPVGLNRQRT